MAERNNGNQLPLGDFESKEKTPGLFDEFEDMMQRFDEQFAGLPIPILSTVFNRLLHMHRSMFEDSQQIVQNALEDPNAEVETSEGPLPGGGHWKSWRITRRYESDQGDKPLIPEALQEKPEEINLRRLPQNKDDIGWV